LKDSIERIFLKWDVLIFFFEKIIKAMEEKKEKIKHTDEAEL